MHQPSTTTYSADHLLSLCCAILEKRGTPTHIARSVANNLIEANLCGVDTHGIWRLPSYVDAIAVGDIIAVKEPSIAIDTPTRLLINGGFGFGQYALDWGLDIAMERCEKIGMCAVNFHGMNHLGRLGGYVTRGAKAGCCTLLMCGSGSGSVAPFGGKTGRLSTNPIAAGIPTGTPDPFVLDFSTSATSEGALHLAVASGEKLCDGTILDSAGNPSNNPADYIDRGSLLPFGGHKGYALSLLTCLLGGLSGKSGPEDCDYGGIFLLLIKTDSLATGEDIYQGMQHFFTWVKSAAPLSGEDHVRIPGEGAAAVRRQRLRDGIPLQADLNERLVKLAKA